MVMGSCVYHVAHRGVLSGLGPVGRNVAFENFTSAMYEAWEIAIERMRSTIERATRSRPATDSSSQFQF
jgi:hypothetical protein